MARVVVAMSGGVDSSTAAWLLRQQGHDVIGLFMRTGVSTGNGPASHKRGCCSSLDAQDARRVADMLNIPFYAVDFSEHFSRVIDYFVDEYSQGRTPNPCVMCNQWLKFGQLWQFGRHLGADFIATGHYAQVVQGPDGPQLQRAVDLSKDQSYVLFGTPPAVLKRLWLPLGGLKKNAVRELAQKAGLPVFAKPDSVSVCFLPDGDVASLVAQSQPQTALPGPIVDRSGQVLGWHRGIAGVTVGQRKGLGLTGGQRRFVLEVLPERQTLVVGSRSEALRAEMLIERCRWLVPTDSVPGRLLQVQYTYRDPPVSATVQLLDSERAIIQFTEPQFGIAPGQAAVCYADSLVLGGGWIAGNK